MKDDLDQWKAAIAHAWDVIENQYDWTPAYQQAAREIPELLSRVTAVSPASHKPIQE